CPARAALGVAINPGDGVVGAASAERAAPAVDVMEEVDLAKIENLADAVVVEGPAVGRPGHRAIEQAPHDMPAVGGKLVAMAFEVDQVALQRVREHRAE